MAGMNSSWTISQGPVRIDPNEKLFLFGYSCKLFPHDDKAETIDKGKHLIPWMGDKTLMIDRYDVRGYLHDLKQYEPASNSHENSSSEEEQLIDEERYRSLRTDMTEEQLYQEEELKRLRAAIASDGAYHEIAFSYDNPVEENVEQVATKFEDPEEDLYQKPEGLEIPKGIEVPYNMKIHAIIEKTANFVSEQGGQMEIIIKMKQHANPQFAFMHLDNPLHPYYKHLVKEIKSGAYKPVQNRRGYDPSPLVQRVSRSEDEEDDGHYLHPSLMAGKAKDVPEFTVPTINFRRSQDDSYSLLVKNLRQHLVEEKNADVSQDQQTFDGTNSLPAECYNEDGTLNIYGQNYELLHNYIVPPPPDIQPVVDKMAEYVAKNGEDFETIVKSKNDKRFDFLYPGKQFHDYYIYKRNCVKAQMFGNSLSEEEIHCENQTKPPETEEIPFISSNSPSQQPENQQPVVLYSHEHTNQDSSDSLDFLNSPSDSKDDDSVAKSSKVPKGPISFSLKVKDSEASPDIGKPTTLLMDDDSEEEEGSGEKDQSMKPKNSEESHVNNNVKPTEVENKAPKVMTEAMEAKLAEERIKDKLLATARERLAQQRKEKLLQQERQERAEQHRKEKQIFLDQQRKEKELQLERKRKAALFLKMLRRKNLDATACESDSVPKPGFTPDFWTLPDTSNCTSPESGILFPLDKIIISTNSANPSVIPGIKTNWSPDHHSDDSPSEEPSNKSSNKHSSDSDSAKQERKKKRRHRSRSRSRERSNRSSRSSRRSKERHRSPPRHYKESKKEKEKQLPAAYAFVNRSRSRSRSPRRYRSIPNWRRR